eukprot:4892498-Karenia_brevis.AAC.1
MDVSVKGVTLPHMPLIPSATKWTKFCPALDFSIVGMHCFMLWRLCNAAYSNITYLHLILGADADIEQDDEWKTKAGKHFK